MIGIGSPAALPSAGAPAGGRLAHDRVASGARPAGGAGRRDGPRHRAAGARRLRQEPRDLRVPRRGRLRPRAVRARDRRACRRSCCGRSGWWSAGGRRGGGSSSTARRWACSSGSPPLQLVSSAARPVAVVVAAVAALVGWVLTVRAKGFRMWSQLLAGLAVMALVAFLVLSPSSDLVMDRDFDAVAAERRGRLGGARSSSTSCPRRRSSTRPVPSTRRGSRTWPGWPARGRGTGTTRRWPGSPPTRCRRSSRVRRRTGGRPALHRPSGQPLPAPRRFARPRRVGGAHAALPRLGVRRSPHRAR